MIEVKTRSNADAVRTAHFCGNNNNWMCHVFVASSLIIAQKHFDSPTRLPLISWRSLESDRSGYFNKKNLSNKVYQSGAILNCPSHRAGWCLTESPSTNRCGCYAVLVSNHCHMCLAMRHKHMQQWYIQTNCGLYDLWSKSWTNISNNSSPVRVTHINDSNKISFLLTKLNYPI